MWAIDNVSLRLSLAAGKWVVNKINADLWQLCPMAPLRRRIFLREEKKIQAVTSAMPSTDIAIIHRLAYWWKGDCAGKYNAGNEITPQREALWIMTDDATLVSEALAQIDLSISPATHVVT